MNDSLLRIISSISGNNEHDQKYNATGEEYLIVGKDDKKIGVVDAYGKVSEIAVSGVKTTRGGNYGEIKLGTDNIIIVKFGRFLVDVGDGSVNVTSYHAFPTPFPNGCISIIAGQEINDHIDNIMIDRQKEGFNAQIIGGNGNEQFSYIAFGY